MQKIPIILGSEDCMSVSRVKKLDQLTRSAMCTLNPNCKVEERYLQQTDACPMSPMFGLLM